MEADDWDSASEASSLSSSVTMVDIDGGLEDDIADFIAASFGELDLRPNFQGEIVPRNVLEHVAENKAFLQTVYLGDVKFDDLWDTLLENPGQITRIETNQDIYNWNQEAGCFDAEAKLDFPLGQ